jgi:hypothetical protein
MNGTTDDSAELTRLRNNEQFAALGQFLFTYGTDVLGLPHDFGREVRNIPTSRAIYIPADSASRN